MNYLKKKHFYYSLHKELFYFTNVCVLESHISLTTDLFSAVRDQHSLPCARPSFHH